MTDTNEKAVPQEGAISDFGIDTTSKSAGESVRDYLAKVRGGELGPLPALLGLLVLVLFFSVRADAFFTLNNLANLLQQGASTAIIAMGLVFVLLLGEIDLSAGTASGVAAALLALHYVRDGNLMLGMGDTVFYIFLVAIVVAVGLSVWMRLWPAAVFAAGGAVVLLLGVPPNPWIEMLLAVCIGTTIGCLTGFLVSRVGIPSFVVTLALFLMWGGVILQLIGQGGTLPIRESKVLFDVANSSMSTGLSWALFVVAVGGYSAVVLSRHFSRLRRGLVAQPTTLVLIQVGTVAVVSAVVTYLLTLNRAQNPSVVIAGVPYVVPVVLALLVVGTLVLDRTKYGRHVYAVGGNAEAARRAGINVPKIRMSVFVIASSVAAIGAIVYSSKVGSVTPQAGGQNTLLFAVGAAVIGGTSLFGGKGRMRDALIGAAVIAVIENGLVLLKQPAAVLSIVTGLVLLLAASVDALSRKRAAVSGR